VARQLDTQAFQRALGDALDRRARDPRQPFIMEGGEFHTDATGALRVAPSLKPADNLLFHDGTNLSLERGMADLAENALTHQTTATLLGRKFDALRKAIRGKA
jgi:flagellar basal body rod protein FlgB